MEDRDRGSDRSRALEAGVVMSIDNVISTLNSAATALVGGRWTTQEDDSGYLYVEPPLATFAGGLGASQDEAALAALVASEVGSLPVQYLYAVAEVGINEAAARGISIATLLTGAPKPGHCGEQRGRWASTSRQPSAKHLLAARLAHAGTASGFTRGARKFFDPKVQDGGLQRGRPLSFDAIGIVRKWYGEGYKWVGPITVPFLGTMLIDPYRLFLMAKTGVSQEEAEAAIQDGRRRWGGGAHADTSNASRELPDGQTAGTIAESIIAPSMLGLAAYAVGKVLGVL